MFGKGVYFADCVSKSANYCCTNRENPTGLLVLCEVALGESNELLRANHSADIELPQGKLSTKGLGNFAPEKSSYVNIGSNVKVPLGKPVPTHVIFLNL